MSIYKIVDIDKDTNYDEWLKFRLSGVGASEIGTLLGLNPYKTATELFYQKLGVIPIKQDENLAMFYGNRLESFVANMWEYYEGSPESIIANFNSDRRVNCAKPVPGYVLNSNYPGMFFSPDRVIVKDKDEPIVKPIKTGWKLMDKNIDGVLEIKTISGFASKQWDGGIPPSYIIQLNTYMMGLDCSYGEIALLEDGRNLWAVRIERSQKLEEQILSAVQEFNDRIEAARGDIDNIHLYEPEPEGTQAYESFINKKYANSEMKTIQGSDDLYNLAKEHQMEADKLKEIEHVVREYTNLLKNVMKEHDTIDFGSKGKVTWKTDSRGFRIFRNSLKK